MLWLIRQSQTRLRAANYKRLKKTTALFLVVCYIRELEKGLDLLNEVDADFYFFEYSIPLYSKFYQFGLAPESVTTANIRFELETGHNRFL
jgi:hypothetical protein